MKSQKSKKSVNSYIQSKPFGNYYLPARFQYLILRDYYKKNKFFFSLPQGEPVFTKTSVRLRDTISKLEINADLVLLSIFVLPEEPKFRGELINKLVSKKIKTHFVFENKIAKSKSQYDEILNILKLHKFNHKI